MSKVKITWRESASQTHPVQLPLPAGFDPTDTWRLVAAGGGAVYPVQPLDETTGVAMLPPAAGTHEFTLERGEAPAVVTTNLSGLDELEIHVAGEHFTTYYCSRDVARPYLFPVLLPGGIPVTRSFPMREVEGEMRDHPHHRSLWSAYGEVNGTDNWSEASGKHAWIRHRAFEHIYQGPVFGGFEANAQWTDTAGAPILAETRRVIVYDAGKDRRLLEYVLSLTPVSGEVHYGDTKEGGLISVRVATSMDGNKGGRIQNSEGGVGEKQVWGKPARWCDYSGPVQGQTVGIAVMDHPSNFRHPARWHARDYGLMTANYFGTSTFEGEKGGTRGEYRQPPDQTLVFRYRVLIHHGDAQAGRVEEAWRQYAGEAEVGVGV